nr:hypothetical protein KPHV_30240 [Kitasatospora purpeofusca]
MSRAWSGSLVRQTSASAGSVGTQPAPAAVAGGVAGAEDRGALGFGATGAVEAAAGPVAVAGGAVAPGAVVLDAAVLDALPPVSSESK